jgi:hypothetical protein
VKVPEALALDEVGPGLELAGNAAVREMFSREECLAAEPKKGHLNLSRNS